LNRGRKADRKGPTCNLPLRSGKGWLYEGGIRVPAIIRLPKSIRERLPERDEPRQAVPSEEGPAQEGPAQDGPAVVGSGQGRAEPKGGVIEKGGVFENGGVIDTPINSFDWMPTLLAACGIKMDIANLDGVDIFQLQSAKGVQNANGPQNANRHTSGTRNLYWHYPHYHGSAWRPGGAIRTDRYKLIEFFEDDRVELYDLKADPGETNDLSAKRPEIAAVLRSELSQWRARSGAVMPTLR
ncbi:MAG: sulfatase/phosphatase domain-containing protein, partial [Planctomycetota bacterium]